MVAAIAYCKISKFQARERALAWITEGAFGFPDASLITFDSVEPYLAPFVKIACEYASHWTATLGEIDQASYRTAQNHYLVAQAAFAAHSQNGKSKVTLAQPQAPRMTDFIQWRPHQGTVTGTWESSLMFSGNLEESALPREFPGWALSIATTMHLDSAATTTEDWRQNSIAQEMRGIEIYKPESLCEALVPSVNKAIEAEVLSPLPPYHKDVRYGVASVGGNGIRWTVTHALMVPLYVVHYRVPRGAHVCVIDGVNGFHVAGEKARDIGGTFKRVWSSIFGARKQQRADDAGTPDEWFDRGQDAEQQNQYDEAAQWYRKAAAAGHTRAQYLLGIMCALGRGVPIDAGEAVHWFRLAADQGCADAQYALGIAYRKGDGVPPDRAEARQWLNDAARQGHAAAQTVLAEMEAEDKGQRQQRQGGQQQGQGQDRQRREEGSRSAPPGNGKMTHRQALEILELQEGATKEQVNAAWKRLMNQVHPDKGGSTFFAKQVNEAREVLLAQFEAANGGNPWT